MSYPSYLTLYESGELARRAKAAVEALAECRICPRQCGADRISKGISKFLSQSGIHSLGIKSPRTNSLPTAVAAPGEGNVAIDFPKEEETYVIGTPRGEGPISKPFCRTGRHTVVSSAFAHHGEEACLRGSNGSGTIFFCRCNLRCVFCQNFDISWEGRGRKTIAAQLAGLMLGLQDQGCHNINLVSPTHVVPQILEALVRAVSDGLRLPLVYNSGGYDSVETLRLLDGVIDIYMPDFKFWDPGVAKQLANAENYGEIARAAVREMHRQVGDLVLNDRGVAQRGLLVRHLVMPNRLAGTREVMQFLAREISPNTYVNIMAQYHPSKHARRCSSIDRRITIAEYEEALDIARDEGLRLDRE
jgi:putative pyruvate formate lyase activating enzyme